MRKLIAILLLITLFSCNEITALDEGEGRIRCIEKTSVDGYHYYILEVYGVEYLSRPNGGFIKLEKPDTTAQ